MGRTKAFFINNVMEERKPQWMVQWRIQNLAYEGVRSSRLRIKENSSEDYPTLLRLKLLRNLF